VSSCSSSPSVELQQRAYELQALLNAPPNVKVGVAGGAWKVQEFLAGVNPGPSTNQVHDIRPCQSCGARVKHECMVQL
jgi:hypothetical protein